MKQFMLWAACAGSIFAVGCRQYMVTQNQLDTAPPPTPAAPVNAIDHYARIEGYFTAKTDQYSTLINAGNTPTYLVAYVEDNNTSHISVRSYATFLKARNLQASVELLKDPYNADMYDFEINVSADMKCSITHKQSVLNPDYIVPEPFTADDMGKNFSKNCEALLKSIGSILNPQKLNPPSTTMLEIASVSDTQR